MLSFISNDKLNFGIYPNGSLCRRSSGHIISYDLAVFLVNHLDMIKKMTKSEHMWADTRLDIAMRLVILSGGRGGWDDEGSR